MSDQERFLARLGPVEATEQAARNEAIQLLLDGLGVGSIAELRRIVRNSRAIDHAILEAIAGGGNAYLASELGVVSLRVA